MKNILLENLLFKLREAVLKKGSFYARIGVFLSGGIDGEYKQHYLKKMVRCKNFSFFADLIKQTRDISKNIEALT